MHDFVLALIGGVMIGLSAVVLMAAQGRVMGVSGIVSHLLPPFDSAAHNDQPGERSWRLLFMAGVIAAPLLSTSIFGYRPEISLDAGPLLLIISGLIVGVGTVTGNGCTSGHGVCGLARLSGRSITATSIFMATAIATVFIANTIFKG